MAQQVSSLAPRRRRDAEANYEAILAAARAMMAERGPAALTVAEVAHRAHVNRTTAYQHFRTREDLVAAVIERLADEISRTLESEMPVGERIDYMVEHFFAHPEIARLWMFQLLGEIPLRNRDGWNRYVGALSTFAASDGAAPGIDPEMLATILLAAVLVWPLRVRTEAGSVAAARAATQRFVRELKRLLLFGAMRPEIWRDLAQEFVRDIPRSRPKKPRSSRERRSNQFGR